MRGVASSASHFHRTLAKMNRFVVDKSEHDDASALASDSVEKIKAQKKDVSMDVKWEAFKHLYKVAKLQQAEAEVDSKYCQTCDERREASGYKTERCAAHHDKSRDKFIADYERMLDLPIASTHTS